MDLKIKFGIDFELERVTYTFNELGWYNKQGYKVRLPNGISEKSSKDEIKDQITKEFDEKKYIDLSNKINSNFLLLQTDFTNVLKKNFDKMPDNFIIYLTNYGVGGSYDFPNKVILNYNYSRGIKTVLHEIVHILIEDKIQKYSVEHWEKERIVDLILNSKEFKFLHYNYWQSGYNDAEKYIDKLFNKYFFKDQEEFFF